MVSKAQIKATAKYNKEHYKHINLQVKEPVFNDPDYLEKENVK